MDILFLQLIALAYLCGSINSAIWICRIFTLPDPTVTGSNNPGATNVLRIGGKKAAIATLAGDMFKTAFPLLIADYFKVETSQLLWLGLFALVGHCFPIFYRFNGGKGVASLLTILVICLPAYGLFFIGTWLLTAWTFKRSSVASIFASLLLPAYIGYFLPYNIMPVLLMSFVILTRHFKNIVRIFKGSEPYLGQ